MTSRWTLPVLAALAMSVGWGYRGDYGHEAGAMMPGALVGLAVALAAGRADWVERASLLGLLGAIGWAFGGQNSYGLLIGYTASDSFPNVAYGLGSIFLVGALWGGIGCGVLALGVTRPRSELERFALPLGLLYLVWWGLYFSGLAGRWQEAHSFHDTDWLPATVAFGVGVIGFLAFPRSRAACGLLVLLAAGWWAGYATLTLGLGLHINPPRSDNWSGCLGLALALFGYLMFTRNRAAVWLGLVGLLAGGLGFVLGDFVNMLGRAEWGPIGASDTLRAMNSWKWMEQGFGLIMGLGVGLAFARMAQAPIAMVVDDAPRSAPLRVLAPTFLLLPMLWENLWKNTRGWTEKGVLRDGLFGLGPTWWCLIVGLAVSAAVLLAIVRAHRGRLPMAPASPFGRAQLLFLVLLWVPALAALLQVMPDLQTPSPLFVHVSFWLTAAACSLIVLSLDPPGEVVADDWKASDAADWRPRRFMLAAWVTVPLVVVLLAAIICWVGDEPLKGSKRRFGESTPTAAP